MSEIVKAMVRVGASQMEMREYPMPDIPEDAALMKVVVAGICGFRSLSADSEITVPCNSNKKSVFEKKFEHRADKKRAISKLIAL